jgi:hypothetical protein
LLTAAYMNMTASGALHLLVQKPMQ